MKTLIMKDIQRNYSTVSCYIFLLSYLHLSTWQSTTLSNLSKGQAHLRLEAAVRTRGYYEFLLTIDRQIKYTLQGQAMVSCRKWRSPFHTKQAKTSWHFRTDCCSRRWVWHVLQSRHTALHKLPPASKTFLLLLHTYCVCSNTRVSDLCNGRTWITWEVTAA